MQEIYCALDTVLLGSYLPHANPRHYFPSYMCPIMRQIGQLLKSDSLRAVCSGFLKSSPLSFCPQCRCGSSTWNLLWSMEKSKDDPSEQWDLSAAQQSIQIMFSALSKFSYFEELTESLPHNDLYKRSSYLYWWLDTALSLQWHTYQEMHKSHWWSRKTTQIRLINEEDSAGDICIQMQSNAITGMIANESSSLMNWLQL